MSNAHLNLSELDRLWKWPETARQVRAGNASADIGRLTGSKTGRGGQGGQAIARKKLARIASGAPEVLVKVTGRKKVGQHAASHICYIGRHGKIELETRDGEILNTKEGMIDYAQSWDGLNDPERRQYVSAVSMVFSMPGGPAPSVVRDAARAVADAEFSHNHDYVMALHTDTNNPHVHISVRVAGDDGRRFNPRKMDLRRYREAFARELRDRGVEAEASPRRARGQVRSGQSMALFKQRQDHRTGRGPQPLVDRRIHAEIRDVLSGKATFQHTAMEIGAAKGWHTARAVYDRAVAVLSRSTDPEDQKLAAKVQGFVSSFPDPNSYRMTLGKQLEQQARAATKSRNEPDKGPER